MQKLINNPLSNIILLLNSEVCFMKYNSIGEQLIAKAQELDPNYKPDKFNDMSEALNIILNNTGGSKITKRTLTIPKSELSLGGDLTADGKHKFYHYD